MNLHAGESTTLQWRTANADQVVIGQRNPEWPQTRSDPILVPQKIKPAGSMQIRPSQTITFALEAKKGAVSSINIVTIQVTSPTSPRATCSITGQIAGKLTWEGRDDRGQPFSITLTDMALKTSGAAEPLRATLRGRTYLFREVPAGQTYTIVPYSFGPLGGNFHSTPREITVLCRPNTTHRLPNFDINGPPSGG